MSLVLKSDLKCLLDFRRSLRIWLCLLCLHITNLGIDHLVHGTKSFVDTYPWHMFSVFSIKIHSMNSKMWH